MVTSVDMTIDSVCETLHKPKGTMIAEGAQWVNKHTALLVETTGMLLNTT